MASSDAFYSAIVPVLNEAGNLRIFVEKLDSVLKNLGKPYEILIINDQGQDNSVAVLESLRIEFPYLRPVYRNTDPGSGFALREGFRQAKGEIIITLDGDLSHDPAEIPYLLQGLDESDMVCGSRYVKGGSAELEWHRQLVSKVFNWSLRQLIGIRIKDITSNFRVFRREVIEKIFLTQGQFGIFIEIPLKTHLAGFRITERPIHYHQREHGSSHSNYKQWQEYFKALNEAIKIRRAISKEA